MVRVLSVHNFLKQDISSVDEVIDIAAVPPDLLLLVKSNNTISVRNLSETDDPGYNIPTIDQSEKIVYSVQGNYVASLENKVTRNGTKVSYVRVYVYWESLKDSKNSFPMRARIAGRVTPLSQTQQGLEMIEIPSKFMPDNLACCSVSGNLLLASRNVVTIYNFVVQVHDISKIHFIDFKLLPVDLHLSFTPLRVQFLENVIAVQNDEFLHVFQIKSSLPICSLSDKEFSIEDFEKVPNSQPKFSKEQKTINYGKLVEEIEKISLSSPFDNINDIERILYDNTSSNDSELYKINLLSFPLKHEFPTIALEKSIVDSGFPDVFRQNPFTSTNDLTVNLLMNSSQPNSHKNQYKIINICQYHLSPLTVNSITNREIHEKFITLILKPFYENGEDGQVIKQRLVESNYYKNLKCIACFFGTQQEGYLHSFELESTTEQETVVCGNYVTYAFTAPLIDVQLSDCFLHAITEAGLETYTMRAAKHLLKKTDSSDCPSSKDPVCLIGLHPFVNILKSFITTNYLTLFANNEESSWTLYQLKTPGAVAVWKDFFNAAEENKWEAPLMYCELLNEGHLILKTILKTVAWVSCKDVAKNNLSFATVAEKKEEKEILNSLYNESCALLGDYHILNKNFKSSYCYYTMSGFKIMNLIKRIKSLWENIPERYRDSYNEKDITMGLIYFLKKTLSYYDQKYYEFVGNREEFFTPEIGNLVTSLIDLLEKEEGAVISDLVLQSAVLREFSTDRILKMLRSLLSKNSDTQDKDALSLALMCIQRDQSEQAKNVLKIMNPTHLEALLLQYYVLLFANHSSTGTNMFTELSMVLIEIYPKVLATVLSDLVTVKRILSLSKVLNFFMNLMPSGGVHSINSSLVLRIVIENYFKCWSENLPTKRFDSKATEAMKILIRIYLTQLQPSNESEKSSGEKETSEILFNNSRFNYLNQMPPFSHEFNQVVTSTGNEEDLSEKQKIILVKLQSLLSFDGIPKECLAEVRNFLSKHPNVFGALSLQVLSASDMQEALKLLIDFAPQSLNQFSKERLTNKDDWKFLVAYLHGKINETNQDSRLKFYQQQILSEILRYVAESLNIEALVDILPKDYDDAERYLAIAQNSAQANHIKTLIMITGKQLLASL